MTVHKPHLSPGQQYARKLYGTEEGGADFDKKKRPYLPLEAQQFIAQRAFCAIAGLGAYSELSGILVMGEPGFVQTQGNSTCLLQLDEGLRSSRILQGIQRAAQEGGTARLALFFICHASRQRLCVHGTAELLSGTSLDLNHSSAPHQSIWIRLTVSQSFFHCSKYIRTHIENLTSSLVSRPSEPQWQSRRLSEWSQTRLSEYILSFIAQASLCFLCSVDQESQSAVNHRGGAPGFLVTLPPNDASPGGTILLPDYKGNGAYEAIGSIFETAQAALVIPNYAAQVALCVSGSARIWELADLPADLVRKCAGAERVIALSVQRVEIQKGNWSASLAYEHAHAQKMRRSVLVLEACEEQRCSS